MGESDLKVFITTGESSCSECGENLGRKAWITLVEGKGALCLACADLDHLLFLPAGDAALTRRARKHSTLSAVVLRWSRARKRYERQGLLVEAEALERAEGECLADEEVRARRREREAARREELDQQYVQEFTRRVRELYPRAVHAAGKWPSPNMPVSSTAGVWVARLRPRATTSSQSGWRSWPTSGTPRRGTTSCSRAAWSVGRRAPRSREKWPESWPRGTCPFSARMR